MKKLWAAFVGLGVALALATCATLKPVLPPSQSGLHGSVYEEWPPHRETGEWWYVTGALEAQGGELYLYQFTIFHLSRNSRDLYLLNLALSDYSSNRHLFEEEFTSNPAKAYGSVDAIVFKNNAIRLSPGSLAIRAEGKKMAFDLTLSISKPAVWHGRDGVIVMGHPEDALERSFYYSFTQLDTKGWISFRDKRGHILRRELRGKSWLDRQWGRFSETGWDWFSFRFFDGEELMLFSFPRTGYREGTYVAADGRATAFSDFEYSVEKWVTYRGKNYGLGWEFTLPYKERRYRVAPLSVKDFNPNRVNHYWEGLSLVYNERAELVGHCVAETTAPSHNRR